MSELRSKGEKCTSKKNFARENSARANVKPSDRVHEEVVYHAGCATPRTHDSFSGDPSCFSKTKRSGRPNPRSFVLYERIQSGGEVHTDAQAGILLAEASSAICVQRFDGSRIVQITLRIAFRCVLHRMVSQGIHR